MKTKILEQYFYLPIFLVILISNFAIFLYLAYFMPELYPNLFDRHATLQYMINRDSPVFLVPVFVVFLFSFRNLAPGRISIIRLIMKILSAYLILGTFVSAAFFIKALF